MIDYEALSFNCIMLGFQILQNVITLNSAAYEIFFFFLTSNPGQGEAPNKMNACLFYSIIEFLLKLTCNVQKHLCNSISSKWLSLTPHCGLECSQREIIVGTGRIEDSVTIWTFHLHPSRIFWLLQQIWCPFSAVGLVWRQQKLARSVGPGAKWQRSPETRQT